MKTPNEIKKGLECCVTIGAKCDGCPYCGECLLPFGDSPESDALAYIQQLEAELAEARKDIDMLGEQAVALDSAYDAMKRERDAAVEDIFPLCTNCKHEKLGYGVGPCPTIEEFVTTDCSNWQWRGVEVE